MTEPTASPPPPPPPPEQPPQPPAQESNRGIMIVLSYLWILFLVPLLVEKQDKEVQWHAKHGMVITIAEILLYVIISILTSTGIGCFFALLTPLIGVIFLVIRILCIVKGINGERFLIPGISQYADKF